MAAANVATSVEFTFSSCIRGFHIYRDIWRPKIDELLQCTQDIGNQNDKHAVAVLHKGTIVGHVPREHAKVFRFFLKRGGTVTVKVTGTQENNGIGIELPAVYTFSGCQKDTEILSSLLKTNSK
jgi:hypothetical protein